MRKGIVYISGPMTGLPDYGRKSFYEAQKILEREGYLVLNPATMPLGMRYEQYMAISIVMLQQADYICMLPGWEYSKGARAERAYADSVRIRSFLLADVMEMAV